MNLTNRCTRASLLGFYIALHLVATVASTLAATVSRGPYLQQGTPNSMVVRWRTDVATDTFVRFGTSTGVFTTTVSDAASVTEHVMPISGLQADTKYYYEIGTSTAWFTGDTNDYFVTSPTVGVAKSTRLWVLGDSGTANANAATVRNGFLAYASATARPADLVLMLGDNAYNSGTDAEYQAAVFNMYPTVLQNTVLWPALGNHDTASSAKPPASLPYFNIFTLPQNGEAGGVASGTEKYYSWDYGNIHFICLDSMSSDRSTNGPMYAWVIADLQANLQPWIIAFWHHPPYTKGSHNSDTETELIQMRQNFLPILESLGVDLVLAGHSHSYERSFLIDSHYGISSTFTQAHKKDGGDGRTDGTGAYVKPATVSPNAGAVYVTAGSSGQISGGTLNHAAMLVSLNQLGSVAIDINSNRLDFTFLRTNGLAGDYFTLIKAAPPTNPPAAPTGLSATPLSSSQISLTWTDNSDDEDGFKVERSTNGIDFTQFTVIGANVANGVDTGLNPSTTYYYRLRAFNVAGDSPYSNIAQGTTPTGPLVSTLIASNSVWKYLDNGTDQGTAWRGPAFNDTTWASGPAELGYGDGGEATVVSFGPNAAAKYITTYFRKSFTVANPAAFTNLLLQLVRDDGPVVYLNGVEVFRNNLPAGAIVFNTLAPVAIGGVDESTYIAANLSPASLIAGNNVVAVEMHQNAGTSSDISFNLQLTATGPGAPPGDTTAPAVVVDLAVSSVTTSSATLTWTAPGDDGNAGTAASYDLRYSTSPIVDANWATATPASGEPTLGAAGTAESFIVSGLAAGTTYYFAVKTTDEANNVSPLSNVPSAATSQTPPAAPTGLTATASSSSEVLLNWTDNANNEDGFRVERSTNGVDFVLLGSTGANVTSGMDGSVQPLTTYHYRVRAFNSAGESADSNVASVTTPGADPNTNVVLVASNAVWKYLDTGVDQGTAWRPPAFNDSTWASGPAELGYGDGGEATVVSFGPDAGNKYVTTYFRKSFTVPNLAGFTNLLLQLVRDDGAVVYLNGTEVYRNNLPTGTVTFSTFAPVAIGGADESTYQSANLSPAALVSGVNVIAVEMHQANGTSTDLSFNLQLTAQGVLFDPPPDTNAPAAVTDLAAGNATPNSITLSWTTPGDDGNTGTASSYDVRLSTAPITEADWDSAAPVSGEQAPGIAGTLENLTIISLDPDTTYYFALKTSDETNNVSPLSNLAGATTLPPPDITAPAAVTDLAVATVTTSSATLTWTAPGDDGVSGTASAYDVRYSTTPITAANWDTATSASGEPVPAAAGFAENFTVTGLSGGTTYHFALKASDENNNVSPLSNVASAATPDVIAPATVANLSVSSVTTNRATVTWTAPGDDGATGAASAYDVRYSTSPITEANWASATPATGEPAPGIAGSAQSFNVTGLSSGTTCYFALKTLDESSNVSPLSNVPLATTAGVPSPWLTRDIGAVAAAGSANHTNGSFILRGSGADIAGSADEFRFVYQAANGDCEIIARVAAVQNTHAAAKAVVMIRESLNANSRHATMALTFGNGLTFLRRTSTGGGSSSISGGSGTAPYWVRLVRVGNNFTAYKSTNGTTWTTVGTRAITMGANVFIGLGVTSRRDGTINTSRFDNVSVTP